VDLSRISADTVAHNFAEGIIALRFVVQHAITRLSIEGSNIAKAFLGQLWQNNGICLAWWYFLAAH
jgi:hypothetical protein